MFFAASGVALTLRHVATPGSAADIYGSFVALRRSAVATGEETVFRALFTNVAGVATVARASARA